MVYAIAGAGKFKITRAGCQARDPGGANVAVLSLKGLWKQNSFFLQRSKYFSLSTFNWLDVAHSHYRL